MRVEGSDRVDLVHFEVGVDVIDVFGLAPVKVVLEHLLGGLLFEFAGTQES